jgi:hypothetical protein
MAENTSNNPAFLYDNITQNPTVINPSASATIDSVTNVVIAGANSLAFTLAATSNSPVWITSFDHIAGAQRTSTTIIANGFTYTLGTSSCTAVCVRYGAPSANKWVILGAQTAS